MISFGGSIISLLLLCREDDFGRMVWEGIWGGWCGRKRGGGKSVLYESSDFRGIRAAMQSSVMFNVRGEILFSPLYYCEWQSTTNGSLDGAVKSSRSFMILRRSRNQSSHRASIS